MIKANTHKCVHTDDDDDDDDSIGNIANKAKKNA